MYFWIHITLQIELCLPDELYSKYNLNTKTDISTVECNNCSNNCLSCDQKSCRSCWINSINIFSQSLCQDQCYTGYYPNLGECKNCMPHCLNCISSIECIKCAEGYVIDPVRLICIASCSSPSLLQND